MKDINEILLNPVRMRIIQELALKQSVTASELCASISDVPRTTMYRHINVLLDSGVVTVVAEKKIRGSLERTLALNVGEITRHNTLENATQNALAFLLNRYARLHTYFSQAGADPGKDRIFLNTTVMMMDDAEFDAFLAELRDVLFKYSFKAGEGRRARDISVISCPAGTNENSI